MNVTDQKATDRKCTNYKAILAILGLSTCLFLAGTIYFLVKFYNQNQIISEQLLEYNNKLISSNNQPLILDDNFDRRIKKLFDELNLVPKQSLFSLIDQGFFNNRILHTNDLLGDPYSINRSAIRVRDQEYLITLSIPGFTKEQIKVELNGNILTIAAENTEQIDKSNSKKSVNSTFKQVISLNNDIDPDAIKSSLQNGVLTINIPRIQQKPNSKTINIE